MSISDLANNPIDANSGSFASLASDVPVFPHDIYSFIISGIRQCDRDAADLFLLRYLEAMQSEFEDTYDRVNALRNLYDPELTPSEALQYVKWIVGFTSRLDFVTGGLTNDELRILIAIAVRMWKFKGTDAGLSIAMSAFSTYPIRILNWFLFRIIVDELEIGREELDVDPWLIDIPGLSPSVLPDAVFEGAGPPPQIKFVLTTLLGATEAVPHDIRIHHVPTKTIVVVASHWDGAANVAFSPDLMGQTSPVSLVTNDYRVGVDPDEFVQDIRVVDDGTGILNRSLVENLARVMRPNSERYNIRYLDFQDTFRDALFWTTVSGTAVHTPASGIIELEDAGGVELATDFPNDSTWTEYQAALQFKVRDETAGEWFEMRFYYTDSLNFYAFKIDPKTRLVLLEKVVGGVRIALIALTIPVFLVDVFYMMRVVTEDAGGGVHLLKIYLDDNILGSASDSAHTAGKLGIATAAGQKATVTFADLFQLPLASTRIGP